jgi:hypothetical protein
MAPYVLVDDYKRFEKPAASILRTGLSDPDDGGRDAL